VARRAEHTAVPAPLAPLGTGRKIAPVAGRGRVRGRGGGRERGLGRGNVGPNRLGGRSHAARLRDGGGSRLDSTADNASEHSHKCRGSAILGTRCRNVSKIRRWPVPWASNYVERARGVANGGQASSNANILASDSRSEPTAFCPRLLNSRHVRAILWPSWRWRARRRIDTGHPGPPHGL